MATLVYPLQGVTNADLAQGIQWTAVPNVQVYYLYVGTAVGEKNLINSGEIQQTWYPAASLPRGQTLYARLWTKVGGVWRYSDSTFSSVGAALTYPVNGATNVDFAKPIRWTTVPGVQAYYLYVGTTPGAKDLVNSGETLQTSFFARTIPRGITLYARMWTRVNNAWTFSDTTFSSNLATITAPIDGATNVDFTQPIRWTPVPNVQTYYLYVGTTPGAKDLINTGEIQTTSYAANNLPRGQTLYARLWTRKGGVWSYSDISFSCSTAAVTYPTNGTTNADLSRSIEWTPVAGAQAYYLYVGSTPGAKNLINTGEIQQTSYPGASLPRGMTVYARLWTRFNGLWSYTDSTFSGGPFGPLVYSGNLVREGAFRVPGGLNSGGQANSGFENGGTAIGFNPTNNSLFMVGHDWDQFVGELSIPEPVLSSNVNDLPTATLLQPLLDAMEGLGNNINPTDPNAKKIGGLLPWGNYLIVTAYSFYDGLATQVSSHFKRAINLTPTGQVKGPLKVGTVGPGLVSGYMGLVPEALQSALGGPVLNGQGGLSVISRTSYGPGVGTLNPAKLGVTNPVPWQPLVYYPQFHETLGLWDQANPNYGGTDNIRGVVLPVGTSTVLFFGLHGETFCYGEGTANPALAGTEFEGGFYCFDPWDSSKGTHGYPYHSYVWAYNVNDLVSVRVGLKEPWEVLPYAVWALPELGGASIGGAAYDPLTGRIFLSRMYGEGELPVVHVYRIQLP